MDFGILSYNRNETNKKRFEERFEGEEDINVLSCAQSGTHWALKTRSDLDRRGVLPLTEIACINNGKGPLREKRGIISKALSLKGGIHSKT